MSDLTEEDRETLRRRGQPAFMWGGDWAPMKALHTEAEMRIAWSAAKEGVRFDPIRAKVILDLWAAEVHADDKAEREQLETKSRQSSGTRRP